jgi:hypothetical protein
MQGYAGSFDQRAEARRGFSQGLLSGLGLALGWGRFGSVTLTQVTALDVELQTSQCCDPYEFAPFHVRVSHPEFT